MSNLPNNDEEENTESKVSVKILVSVFLLTVCVLSAVIGVMNYYVNPYKIFRPDLKLTQSYDLMLDRKIIYPKLKLNSHNDYWGVFIGPSSMLTSISDMNLEKILPEKKIYGLALSSAVPEEEYELLKNFVKVNPEVKKVFVAVDFDQMTNLTKSLLPEWGGDKLSAEDLFFLLYSVQTTKYSIHSLCLSVMDEYSQPIMKIYQKYKILENIEFLKEYEKFRESRFPKKRYTDWYSRLIYEELFVYLRKIKEFCEKEHIDVVFYASPLHANALYDIEYQGVYDKLELFKRDLVKITPFYDFLYVCDWSDKPITTDNPYWIDVFHSDQPLGYVMLERLVKNKGTFGKYITKDNIEKELKTDKQNLEKYAKNNAKYLKKYVTYGHLDDSPEE